MILSRHSQLSPMGCRKDASLVTALSLPWAPPHMLCTCSAFGIHAAVMFPASSRRILVHASQGSVVLGTSVPHCQPARGENAPGCLLRGKIWSEPSFAHTDWREMLLMESRGTSQHKLLPRSVFFL